MFKKKNFNHIKMLNQIQKFIHRIEITLFL